MIHPYQQIIDANINRVSEGLRVIEDFTRFISRQKPLTLELSRIRKEVNQTEINLIPNLLIRDTTKDMRAAEVPARRPDSVSLLKANFKRIEEGLRVLEEYTGNSLFNKFRYRMYELEKEILLTSLKQPLQPGVYLISDDPKILVQGLKWNVSVIQLRDKKGRKEEILKKALFLAKKAKAVGIPFIVNDYLDIAMLSEADGLHTGQDDLDIPSLRKMLGPHKILGRSTHSLAEGLKAQKDGADYVGIGPIFATATKPERAPIGLSYLKKAKEKLAIPYVAIGNVNLQTLEEIAPCQPPLVAIVRAYKDIPKIQKKYMLELRSR